MNARSARRGVAALALVSGLALLWGAPPAFDWMRVHAAGASGGAPTCSFRVRTGYPCLGCGGTTALVLAAHGDLRGAVAANPLGAAVGLGAWATVLGAFLTFVTARFAFLKAAIGFVVVSLPLAFFGNAVHWWMSLPASARF